MIPSSPPAIFPSAEESVTIENTISDGLRNLLRRIRPLHPAIDQPLGLGFGPVPPGYLVTLFQQPGHHVAAHHAQPHKPQFC